MAELPTGFPMEHRSGKGFLVVAQDPAAVFEEIRVSALGPGK
jgi:hypothetical protein